ncbi:MAG: hypothetical protein JRI59_01705 [Deltaproteobacteria bacterium]|nr:hypothetical protein [Deltaproteobacteria bacterium]
MPLGPLRDTNSHFLHLGRWLAGLVLLLVCLTGASQHAWSGSGFIDFFNEDLFFERVQALSRIKVGTTATQVVRLAGEPVEKTALDDGSRGSLPLPGALTRQTGFMAPGLPRVIN